MTHVEATNGAVSLQTWGDARLTARVYQTGSHSSVIRVTHPSYAAPVVIAEAYEVKAWMDGCVILAHPDPVNA